MTVNELIKSLEDLKKDGHGDKKVEFLLNRFSGDVNSIDYVYLETNCVSLRSFMN